MSPKYQISGTLHTDAWFGATGSTERKEALIAWLLAASWAPKEVVSGVLRHTRTGREVWFADVPVAETRITFVIVDVPARCIHVLDVSDEHFARPG